MLGGAYLCYEGAEKVYEVVFPHGARHHEEATGAAPSDPAELERAKVNSAIRTDFILSAEIMAIALSTIADAGLATQAVVLAIVGVGITFVVYGSVAIIVKVDDVGLALARTEGSGALTGAVRGFGRGLVGGMPAFLKGLSVVGTAAMIWVGGGIIIHGLAVFGWHGPEHLVESAAVWVGGQTDSLSGLVHFAVTALGAGVVGLAVGLGLIPLVEKVIAPLARALRERFSR